MTLPAMLATCKWRFEAVPDYFIDYVGASRNTSNFRATTQPLLGLLDTSLDNDQEPANGDTPWRRFTKHVESLNRQGPASTSYKVIYITRHGLGYHNVFEAQVGREAWNSKWSHMDGDGHVVWADSHLHDQGIEQANRLSQFWVTATNEHGLQVPESIYTSPLARCLETTKLVFRDSVVRQGLRFQPVIKEALRERITDHTCDRRSTLSWIKQHYPDYLLEPGFSENDPWWSGGQWESAEEHQGREQQFFEELFENDPNTFISLTTHSYTISAILGAVGLPQFRVSEGSSIALLVKGEKLVKPESKSSDG